MVLANQGMSIADATRHIENNNGEAAARIARHILHEQPKHAGALRIMALVASLRRDNKETLRLLKKCIALAPNQHMLYYDLGRACMDSSRFDEGLEAFNQAIKALPDNLEVIAAKANLLEKAGRFAESRRFLEPYFQRGVATPFMAVVMGALDLHAGDYQAAVRTVMPFTEVATSRPREHRILWQTAGKAYEKLGDVRSAFDAFSKANQVESQPFDREEYRAMIDHLIAVFTRENLSQVPKGRDQSELPIFVASMPRSGSTLVEQIIHAHPLAYGAGELSQFGIMVGELALTVASVHAYPECLIDFTQEHVDRLAASHLKFLRSIQPGKKRIVDKNIGNWRFAGLISVLLPGARMVNVHRDPLDNGFSIFIADLDPRSTPYATDLGNTGFVYSQFRRLMDHWRAELDIQMLDVQYEELVADPDTWIRKIIDFTGLPWHDQCLRYYEAKRDVITLSYDQVRKPIYKSAVARWKMYEEFLGPLKEALGEANA